MDLYLKNLESQLKRQQRQRIWLPRRHRLNQICFDFFKRALDVLGSGLGLLMLSPLFALTAALIYAEDRGPVFFSQNRVGKYGQLFKMYKFRSMLCNAETLKSQLQHLNESSDGVLFKSRRDPRITRVGKVIRRLSIDELPQLWNVFIGDMSLVGPRPPVPAEVELYQPDERKRLAATPGITCIWQVSGRSEIPFKQQVKMDQDYIARRSVSMDLQLLAMTVKAVVGGKGAY